MIYFDNAATTKISDCAAEEMMCVMKENYANPASAHSMGFQAEKKILYAKKIISDSIACKSDEIYFTSGGTESNNWAIFGTAEGRQRLGNHIISTQIEHPAVINPLKTLEEKGFKVTYVSVDSRGYIDLDELKESITPQTILASIIYANNEVGTVQHIDEIGKIIKEKNSNIFYHTDAVQAFGKYKINVNKSSLDMLSASAHKFHGPRGIGIFYLKSGINVKPIILGGGQQNNMRGGTENTAATAGMAVAFKESLEHMEENKNVYNIKKRLSEGILKQIKGTCINGDNTEKCSPYILNVAFENIRSETLLHMLAEKQIFVSAGSACSSKNKNLSHVLTAMGLNKNIIQGSIRFSFSKFNTIQEVDYCLEVLKESVSFLRR